MKNPFKRFRAASGTDAAPPPELETLPEPVPEPVPEPEDIPQEPADPFVEWRRTKVQGGIEKRERNDIYEAYNVYGTDGQGNLICRHYHRYPEHERDFGLSYTRVLNFDEFNQRLLAELDKYSLSLADYHACIAQAEQLLSAKADACTPYEDFSEAETAALRDFCDSMDNLTDKEYLHADGIFRCGCRSAVGNDRLSLWFRKPLPHDAADKDTAGVARQPVEGYDIDNLWIMGVYNRLRNHCTKCSAVLLTSEWSLEHESVYLITIEGFCGVEDTLLLAVADTSAFARFGFFSLDFSRK